MIENAKNKETDTTDTNPRVVVRGQFAKTISFNNPSAPDSFFTQLEEKPMIETNFIVKPQPIKDSVYEVTLALTVQAKHKDETLFDITIDYSGLFDIENVDEQRLEFLLYVYCPTMLFPYTRRIVTDLTRDGGFHPLLLEPVDFARLYHEKKTAKQGENA